MTDSSDSQRFWAAPEIGLDEQRTSTDASGHHHTDEPYTKFQYDPQDPRMAVYRGMRYDEFAATRTQHPMVQGILADWARTLEAPFTGVTSDGRVIPGLYDAIPAPPHAAPVQAMVEAAGRLLDLLDPVEREQIRYELDAIEWREWSNPEFLVYRVGVRLEDLAQERIDAVLALVRASLSDVGYERVVTTMRLNAYLGSLVELPTVLGEFSYQFAIYGEPSTDAPWGWQLFGHHIAINVLVQGRREVIAPLFLGGEPNEMPGNDSVAFKDRQRIALELAHSLSVAQRAKAVIYESMRDPKMPEGRLHPFDERHVAGAFQDNRMIPYEGIPVSALDDRQRGLVMAIVEDQLALLPDGPRHAELAAVRAHLDETWFAWIGEIGDDGKTPFYFRIQSPVYIAEFDHHAGVWLANQTPEVFHTHTLLRYPNGNDYGKAYIAQWRASRTTAAPN